LLKISSNRREKLHKNLKGGYFFAAPGRYLVSRPTFKPSVRKGPLHSHSGAVNLCSRFIRIRLNCQSPV